MLARACADSCASLSRASGPPTLGFGGWLLRLQPRSAHCQITCNHLSWQNRTRRPFTTERALPGRLQLRMGRTLALMEAAIWTVMLLPMEATCWNSTVAQNPKGPQMLYDRSRYLHLRWAVSHTCYGSRHSPATMMLRILGLSFQKRKPFRHIKMINSKFEQETCSISQSSLQDLSITKAAEGPSGNCSRSHHQWMRQPVHKPWNSSGGAPPTPDLDWSHL